MSAAPAPVTIPAGTVVAVTLTATDALRAGEHMRSMAHAGLCGPADAGDLFARVGGQLAAAARASTLCAATLPSDPYELGRLDAERGAPASELLVLDDALAQAEYRRGLAEHARYYLVVGLRGLRIQHGPFRWDTAHGERVELLDLPDTGIDHVEIISAHNIEVR